MIAVLTGDIVNSQTVTDPEDWIQPLKSYLSQWGSSPQRWEIYRGDSFQLEVDHPATAIQIAIHLKAIVKTVKDLDLRLAIGLGAKAYDGNKVTESNGSAFVRSGQAFERLKKATALAIASGWKDFDEEMNLYLKLANVIMSGWKPATAEIVSAYLSNPDLSQKDLGELIGMTQPSVSDALSRASYYELKELVQYYRKRVNQLSEVK